MKQIYKLFPNEDSYKEYLMKLKWDNRVSCPFCNAFNNTYIKNTYRYHCNLCNTNFSIISDTIMRKTKVDLRKWLISIYLLLTDEKLSHRKLAEKTHINKKSAYRIIKKVNYLYSTKKLEIARISGLHKSDIEILSCILLISIR